MDVGEAAEALGMDPADVYRAIDRGDLAAQRSGRRIRVPAAAITDYRAHH